MMAFQICDSEFNLDRHLISFLQDNPFFAELSRHIHKSSTKSIPTAAVSFDIKNDEITLWWNPDFFSKLSPKEIRGVLTHEYYHLVFGHLCGRKRTPSKLWNISTDLAINSIIESSSKSGNGHRLEGDKFLPDGCLIPGVLPKHPEGRDFSTEEIAALPLAEIISKLPPMQSSEWYFDKIMEDMKDKFDSNVTYEFGNIDSIDEHGVWEDLPEEVREYVESKVKSIVEKASKHADSQANGWGNIPIDLIDSIRKSVSHIINWRTVLRQFVGSLVRGGRSTSIKRINKRYPYIHPGVKRGYEAKLLVAIDQSGSVDNVMLSELFAELGSLTKKVTIDVIPFDTVALEKDLYTWHKGTNASIKRVRGGGTDFNAPTQFANDPKNRGRWDGLLVMTDGDAPAPSGSRIKRAWVLARGQNLNFKTQELVVLMSNEKSENAWR